MAKKTRSDGPIWRKSSRSGSDANCVEVAFVADDAVAVRDSKNPDGAALSFSHRAFGEFVHAAKLNRSGLPRRDR